MKNRKNLKASLCLLLSLLFIFPNGGIRAAAASTPVSIATEYEWEVLKIVNQNRIQEGLQALSLTASLQDAADTRATELLTSYSHTRPDGSSFTTVLSEYSITYSALSENIWEGAETAEAAMDGLMSSTGQKDNILDTDYQHIGVGHSYDSITDYGNCWVQIFIQAGSNSFSDLALYGEQSQSITLSAGQTLSDLNLALQCTSSIYGTCYLPLIEEMCTGFSAAATGTQTVAVNYQGLTLTLYVYSKADRDAPTGLQTEPPSSDTASDGKITGISADMEYRPEGTSAYIQCAGSSIENLTEGTYYVRYKETESYHASPDTAVVISFIKADRDAPTGLQTEPPSSDTASDGKITGVSADMEYRPEDTSSYTDCTGSSIDNLTVGTYYVRYKETDTYNASADATVVIVFSAKKADQTAPAGLQAESPSSDTASDGKITGVSVEMEYRPEGTSSYTDCTGSSIDDLTVGTYYVRYKETDTYNASPDAMVVIVFSATKANQTAPAGLQSVSASSATSSDGQITGVSNAMEYRSSVSSEYTGCTGSSIGNLTVGTYYVRYKETDTYNASPDTAVVISYTSTKANQAAPTGLQIEPTSSATASDGKITGVSAYMEYRPEGSGVYSDCTGTSIENLTAGTYYVRYKETDTHDASPDTTIVISFSAAKADCAAPTGLQAVPASSSSASDGRIIGVSTAMEYRSFGSGSYTDCPESSIENLTVGSYYIRYKETDTHNASPDTLIIVSYPTSDDLYLTISFNGYTCGSTYIQPHWKISNPDDAEITAVGAYVYSESETLLGMYTENNPGSDSGYFELSRETGVDIQPDTTYRIVLFAKTAGSEVTSSAITVTTDGDDPTTINPFADVADNAWYYDSVMYVYENNIFAGTSDTTFSPGDTMTRAMMVQVLYNLEGASETASAEFTDVNSTAWYADAVNWAAENNVVAGVGNNSFSPGTPITREEMAVILSNYCEYKGITLPQSRAYETFTDQRVISSWAENQVAAMYCAAVLSGMGDGTFHPKGNATRSQVAAMFKSFMEVIGV